ncbi:hypothetical protein NQ314_005449 [Rhamnusium bicolor]|uniref:Uncharacterized protein n=1 Tax=Rhamnusium bicolor TaxID=1586634 RepID=A0AAV8ZGZ1_9CUCU|nr:hypothetical protein NQ314_005449 [Rhamnusium bicolor]
MDRVSKLAAEWLVKSGKFYGVGLDTPSVDPGKSTDFIAHRIFWQKPDVRHGEREIDRRIAR